MAHKESSLKLLEPIATKVGMLVIEWNDMCETFGSLFAAIMHPRDPISWRAIAVWNSIVSDKTQRDMLQAAAKAWASIDEAQAAAPKLGDDVEWLCGRANSLSDQRNNFVHSPMTFRLVDNVQTAVVPSTFFNHPRASRLEDRDLIEDLNKFIEYAERLKLFARNIQASIQFGPTVHPWPDRPGLPALRQK